MADNDTQEKHTGWRRRQGFRVDVLLLAFLLIGWSLIFTTATLGLQPWNDQPWLDVSLIPQVAADYSARVGNSPKLARIEPEIIDAVRQDQILRSTPTPSAVALAATPTLTTEPTVTPTFDPGGLEISAGGPYSGEEGSQIALVAENINLLLGLVPGAITYLWDFNNDGLYDDATGASASVVFKDEGEYTISVQATDLLGRVGFDTTTVSVSNVPPLVNIGEDFEAEEGEEIAFSAFASDPGQDILLYSWDFNDGSPVVRDTLNPRHTFANDGLYTVRLRVRDNDGGVSEDFLLVNVLNLPPLVDAGPDQVINEGSPVTFEGTATDPGILDKLTYAWDFNYDGRTFTPDVRDRTASTVYPNGPATIIAALRVQDEDGGQTIDTLEVTVNNVPPVITSVSNDGPEGEGSSLALTVSATDVGKEDSLTYAFDWENNGSFDVTGQPGAVSNIWYNQGSYTVRIRVDDGDGGQAFTTTTVSVFNQPPIAVASADPARLEGSPVSFDGSDSSDPGINDVLTHTWSFGDGSTAKGINVTHTYADNKVYSTTLTVTDDSGESSVASVPVTVLNANPTANAGPDLTVNEGDNVSLTVTGTASDPGTADIPTLTFDWDCDDRDGVIFNVSGASATCVYPSLDGLKNDISSFIVTLRVRDDDYNATPSGGNEIGEAVDTLRVTIKNIPPANVRIEEPLGNPYRTTSGIPVRFRGNGTDVSTDLPLSFRWDFNYNGSTFEEDAAGQVVTNTWAIPGTYRVALQVDDNDGGLTTAVTRVIVGGPPTAEANGPYSGNEGLPITLSSAGSSDPDGDPLTYRWDFGDGTPPLITDSITFTHIYSDNGIFSAILRVDDGRGGIATDVATVTVNNIAPTAVAAAIPNPTSEGAPITFDSSGSGAGPYDVLTYEWDFGDGTPVDNRPIAPRAYADDGVYNASLTVTDDDGSVDTTALVVTVTNAAPTAVSAGGPYSTTANGSITLSGNGTDVPADLPLTFRWDFDYDGTIFDVDATGQTPTYNQSTAGAYTLALQADDGDGGVTIATTTINVNGAPIANAGPDQTAAEGATVDFDGSGSSDPEGGSLTFAWDLDGDGQFDDASTPTAAYSWGEPGTYTVALLVTDPQGLTGTDTVQVTVTNLPPTANAGPDQTVAEGATVTLDGSGSSDPGGGSLTYAWDLDGDGQFDDASTATIDFSQGEPGTFTVALLIADAQGLTSTDTAQVTVTNLPPAAEAGPDQTVNAGDVVTFDGGSSSDPGGGSLGYTWDLDNDGAFDDGSGQTVNYTWTISGTYTIILQVDDSDGGLATDTATVQVN